MSVDQNSFINENLPRSIAHYLTAGSHRDLYLEWLRGMRDVRAKVAVIRRVGQLERGLFGDHKFCRDGVWELLVDVGQGYRIYYARPGSMVLLLGGWHQAKPAGRHRKSRHGVDGLATENR